MKKKLFCLTLMLVLIFSAAALSEGQDAASFLVGPEQYRTVGAHVTFGTYPQTETGEDRTPIEWMVMEVDEENHKAFLLSFRGLDSKRYHREYTNVTWETCSLRAWLNDEFLNTAFTPEEQAAILTTEVKNDSKQCYGWTTSGGKDTQDKIFLLSYAEAFRFFQIQFGVRNNVAARIVPTAYASKAGARQDNRKNKAEDGSIAGWWFLRSPGCFQNCAAAVGTVGQVLRVPAHAEVGTVVGLPGDQIDEGSKALPSSQTERGTRHMAKVHPSSSFFSSCRLMRTATYLTPRLPGVPQRLLSLSAASVASAAVLCIEIVWRLPRSMRWTANFAHG